MPIATLLDELPPPVPDPDRRSYRWMMVNAVLAAAAIGLVAYLVGQGFAPQAGPPTRVPRSAAMEARTGVRFSRVAVVGDGGLVTVFYVVLDAERATRFQADREHPPTLVSEARDLSTRRASIMRAGHLMRPGQTYYLVYDDLRDAIRSGETMAITYDGVTLRHVPVL